MFKEKFLYNLATDKYRGFMASLIKALLFIISIIYGLAVRILILFYRISPYRMDCKVISAGNITLGGTGKTSLVEYVARYLKSQGRKVAVLSRGYKRKIQNQKSLPAGQAGKIQNYETMGDEPYMLQTNLKDIPVIVDIDRIRAAKQAIKDYGVDTVILDDGLQQWKIRKDLEVVTIDATNPFGNQHLIPRGILREPTSSLKRADVFIITKTNLNPDIQDIENVLSEINPAAQIIESMHRPLGFYEIDKQDELLKLEILKAETVTLISGIADPDSFENLIINLGIKVGLSFRFPDHYYYSEEDLENIIKESQNKNIDTIVTTQKDAVRLQGLGVTPASPVGRGWGLRVLVLHIELKITKNEEEFHNRLLRLYNI